jgi:gas vesicle protein
MQIKAFLAGLGLGVVVAVLFAPRSGGETRDMISEKVDRGKQFVNDKMEEVTFRVAEAADDAVERIVIKQVNASDAAEPQSVEFPGSEAQAS